MARVVVTMTPVLRSRSSRPGRTEARHYCRIVSLLQTERGARGDLTNARESAILPPTFGVSLKGAAMTTTTETKHGLEVGNPAVRSVGALAFGPDGVLFVADNVSATIFAIDTQDEAVANEPRPLDIDQLDTRLAAYLGCSREDVLIRGMAVHPASQVVYLSVMRGTGASAVPVIVKVARDATFSDLALDRVPFSQTTIEDAPADDDDRTDWRRVQGNREGETTMRRDGSPMRVSRDPFRTITVTDMAYLPRKADWTVHGQLLVAGASNEEFSSVFRRIPFPFKKSGQKTALEIYHVNHGQYETVSPIRTFIPYAGGASILASYTCTPLVHFSLSELQPGGQATGRTVGELGGGSTPVDMVTYTRDGEEYLLVANSGLPLMKVACGDIDAQVALTEPRQPEGVARQELSQQGVGQMANLNDVYVLMLGQDDEGNASLHAYPTASL